MNTDSLIDLLPEHLKQGVLSGELEVMPGQNPEKPVVRNRSTGRLVKGSGRYPNANDAARVGKLTGYKNSKNYREAIEALVPIDGDESVRGSFAWWVDQARQAAEGSPQRITCPQCNYSGIYAFKKDGQVIVKLIEMVHGRARETQDINLRSESVVAILNERPDVREIQVHTIDPNEVERRKALLADSE